jgi:hypothetical protein
LKNEIKCIELGLLGDGLEKISIKLRHPRGITLSRCQSLPNDPMKDKQLRLEVGDGEILEVGGRIHGSHLIKTKNIAIMKIQTVLGRSTKSQDRGKTANGDRVLCAIGHPSDVRAVLVEEKCGVEL